MWYCELTYRSIQHILSRPWERLEYLRILIGDSEIKYSNHEKGPLSDQLVEGLCKIIAKK
jgi:hypothetical protein